MALACAPEWAFKAVPHPLAEMSTLGAVTRLRGRMSVLSAIPNSQPAWATWARLRDHDKGMRARARMGNPTA